MSELRLVFLGTGAARPTPKRNVAALYVQYEGTAVLFDCGEGTQMQLLHAGVKTSRLDAICVTHFHGDHINGLPGFLGTMGLNGHTTPVTLVGPRGMDRYLRTLADLLICRPGFPLSLVENAPGLVYETDAFTIEACRLHHRVPTHGFLFREHDHPGRFDVETAKALGVPPGPLFGKLQRGEAVQLEDGSEVQPAQVLGETRAGRSFAYISDTRPSSTVVDFVQGIDLLVHEATYLHEYADQARDRGHSTVREAAQVAERAGVGRLILTHISPKHHSKREILKEAREIFPNTELASDLASFELPIPA